MLRFRRFQSRLLVFLFVPLVLVLAAVYAAVDRANRANALALITEDLRTAAANFEAAIAARNELLAISGSTLSQDYAFKPVYETQDPATILSALENLRERLGNASFIAIAGNADGRLIADTRRPGAGGPAPEWLALIEEARALDLRGEFPEAADTILLDVRPYHLTVEPYLAPDVRAWVALGFELDGDFTAEFQRSVTADVTVLTAAAGGWTVHASTLRPPLRQELAASLAKREPVPALIRLAGEDYVTLATPVSRDGRSVVAVLQRSLSRQLAPFEALRRTLLALFALGLAALAAGLIVVSRHVTRPLLQLRRGALRIEDGDYTQRVELPHRDEIGALAQAFNGMTKGLAEKEKVRNLLGKVVSREVAEELLRKDIELGGEEREVTMLFADVRGFTTLCEGMPPARVLALLNEYFSAVAAVIEAHGGIVDKYIGDAVMALFGAPVALADAPTQAVRTALGMNDALQDLNRRFAGRGLGELRIGIGINSDRVVAGNMGSEARLNYTVIGDGVNLASRLEGLSGRYGVTIVVSEATRAAAPGFLYQELDTVRVKGKHAAVRIHTPLGELAAAPPALVSCLAQYDEFLGAYRVGAFAEAAAMLERYAERCAAEGVASNATLVALYRARLARLRAEPPAAWDGVHTHADK